MTEPRGAEAGERSAAPGDDAVVDRVLGVEEAETDDAGAAVVGVDVVEVGVVEIDVVEVGPEDLEAVVDEAVFEPTGEPRVDDAVARLQDVDAAPTSEHVGVYEDVHARLQDALRDIGSGD